MKPKNFLCSSQSKGMSRDSNISGSNPSGAVPVSNAFWMSGANKLTLSRKMDPYRTRDFWDRVKSNDALTINTDHSVAPVKHPES